jgi:hypothetical protein
MLSFTRHTSSNFLVEKLKKESAFMFVNITEGIKQPENRRAFFLTLNFDNSGFLPACGLGGRPSSRSLHVTGS